MHSTRNLQASPPPRPTCDALLASGRRVGKVCGARASFYDPARKHNLCGSHSYGIDNVRNGQGPSWYETPARVDGLNAASPGDVCETNRHLEPRPAKAIKGGIALCMMCSFEAELVELRAYLATAEAA